MKKTGQISPLIASFDLTRITLVLMMSPIMMKVWNPIVLLRHKVKMVNQCRQKILKRKVNTCIACISDMDRRTLITIARIVCNTINLIFEIIRNYHTFLTILFSCRKRGFCDEYCFCDPKRCSIQRSGCVCIDECKKSTCPCFRLNLECDPNVLS